MKQSLIQKYNQPGPRYTSYPTVPYWDASSFTTSTYLSTLKSTFLAKKEEGMSLYIHLPFCESLCTFCACHKHITKRHEVEKEYIDSLLKEWDLYIHLFAEKPLIKEIHLGGGTPTFFSSKNLVNLIEGILEKSTLSKEYDFSFEAHPNHTSKEQMQSLYSLGFRRISFGIQDYDQKVQKAIHRIQSFEQVKTVCQWAREIGYESMSHDLIFGLPFQTLQNIEDNIEKTAQLLPERISLYSYAHVPWVKGVGQRGFEESDLPNAQEKRRLYETAKKSLIALGYEEIGMDHFALKSDGLYLATQHQKLHRNFMGYTTTKTQIMVGLGMSAISDCWGGFAQNVKTVKDYQHIVNEGQFPFFRGHILSEEDKVIRKHILNIMCYSKTSWQDQSMVFDGLEEAISLLDEMVKDKLIEIKNKTLTVFPMATPFIRNVCMAFDKHLNENRPTKSVFSMTI